eukprot:GHVQ01019320.1.p1 GENE.GHVQ01019320.1~~GHVQ01019320.1.p1  ORF type:complete len:928 (-),score=151.08 GHVQ01019320.1:98-2881(-)
MPTHRHTHNRQTYTHTHSQYTYTVDKHTHTHIHNTHTHTYTHTHTNTHTHTQIAIMLCSSRVKDVSCTANLFTIKLNDTRPAYLYNILFESETPGTPSPVEETVLWRRIVNNRKTREKAKQILGLDHFIVVSTTAAIGIPSCDVKVGYLEYAQDEFSFFATPFKLKFVRRDNPVEANTSEYESFINNMIRTAIRMAQFTQIRKDHYNLSAKGIQAGPELHLFPGIETQFLQTNDGIPKLQILPKFLVLQTCTAFDDIKKLLRGNSKAEVEEQVRNKYFISKAKNMPYRCDKIIWPETSKLALDTEFTMKDGTNKSIRDYYREIYPELARELKEDEPVLLYADKKRPDQPLMFPSSLCRFKGLTQAQDNDNQLKKTLSNETRKPPEFRIKVAQELAQTIKGPLKDMGVTVEAKPYIVKGKCIGESEYFACRLSRDGREKRMQPGGTLFLNDAQTTFEPPHVLTDEGQDGEEIRGLTKNRWILQGENLSQQGRMVFDKMVAQFKRDPFAGRGFAVDFPIRVDMITNSRAGEWLSKLKAAIADATKQSEDDEGPLVVVVLLPRSGDAIYTQLKNFLCNLRGDEDDDANVVVSQFISNRTLSSNTGPKPKLDTAMEKICCQIYNKLGGIIWTMPRTNKKYSRMIVGIDSAPVPSKGCNVFSMVATSDPDFSSYFSSRPATAKDTIIVGLKKFIPSAIRAWWEKCADLPDHIIVYRDGGAEGELGKVKEYEEEAVLQGLKETESKIAKLRGKEESRLEKAKGNEKKMNETRKKIANLSKPMPRVLFAVCNKKMQYRFALTTPRGRGNSNPPSATIFKEGVVKGKQDSEASMNKYEFLCIHQDVHNSASVTPTRYFTIYNEIPQNELPEDEFQIITQQLSLMYPNWQGMVRVPGPVMMANKQARMCSELLKTSDLENDAEFYSERLRKRLWYL